MNDSGFNQSFSGSLTLTLNNDLTDFVTSSTINSNIYPVKAIIGCDNISKNS